MTGRKAHITVFSALLALLFIMASYSALLAVDLTPIPGYVDDARKVIKDEKILALPEMINGKPIKDLKGSDEINRNLDKASQAKARIIAGIIVYDNIRKKFEQSMSYMKTNQGEANPDSVFGGKFTPVSTESLLKETTIPISDSQKDMVKKAIDDLLKIMDIVSFEKWAYDDKKIEVKRAAIFYSNVVRKNENEINTALKLYKEATEGSGDAYKQLLKRSITIDFRIGDTAGYQGVKRNFSESDPLIIGVNYSTEGLDGEIPIEWTITSPDGKVLSNKNKLQGGKTGEYLKLIEGKIPAKADPGVYEINLVVYPGEGSFRYKEHYNVGGMPLNITTAFVLGKDKKHQQVFKPGEEIYLVVQYKPVGMAEEEAMFSWDVFDPSGSPVANLSLAKSLKLKSSDKDIQTKFIKAVVPKNSTGGDYTYQATIKAGASEAKSDVISFTVASGMVVRITCDKKTAKVGEKVVFTSEVIGGKAPYTLTWQSDTGKTSSSKSVAMIFRNAGKRWVTLTVSDSAKPKAASKTIRYSIDVE
ncbi:MAG: PKD domain-containing protein [Firmicutes bacterium]|nr:PKD domain-containing protein [Bacillota bacterium]